MSLFQKTVEQKYLKLLDSNLIETKYNEFKLYFGNPTVQENIRNSKEEQFQEGFLRELFVNILGYTLNPSPDFNLTTEYKNLKDSKKADGAVLINAKVKAIIELKGTDTTDLAKVESQAFGYKNNQPDCVYIITSNFEKLRFYIDNAIEHIEFNLFALTKQDFEILYLCLSFNSISNGIPKKIKDESVSHEDKITKDLYRDYSVFKAQLYQNLVELNPQFDQLTLYKKSQKLLDRFLFLFFAEDRFLLPVNYTRIVIKQWKQLKELDEYIPLYERFKKHFNYLNTGYKGSDFEVYAYNGGLFKPDDILDSVIIDDNLLYNHTLKISEYDFASEVDVNILGHIFENSLNEFEEITAQHMAVESNRRVYPSVSKRKKDGVFYTPKYITKYIVDNTVGKLCADKKLELEMNEEEYTTDKKRLKKTKAALFEKLKVYREWLLQLTICDPACGSGAFLNQALDFLITEHRYVDELQAKLFGDSLVLSDIEKSILENNLFGVDLNEESVEIAKLSLWLRTAQPNRKLSNLNNNIKCGNSLIDDPTVAGDKAFSWQKEFPKVFQEKSKKAFHITFVLHNSRYATIDGTTHGLKKEPGFIARTFPELDEKEQEIVAEELAKAAKEYNLNILECNVCNDHVHAIIVCDEEELSTLVGKWKGRTAFEYNRHVANRRVNPSVTDPSVTDPSVTDPSVTVPSVEEKPAANYADGTIEKLWAKSFHQNLITDEEQLKNTIHYIRNNRQKHNLPPATNGLTRWLTAMRCTYNHAFRTEYKGGFDILIGNPPYGAKFNENEKEFCKKRYSKSTEGKIDSYRIFIEKCFELGNDLALISLITPNTFLYNIQSYALRDLILKSTSIYDAIELRKNIFEDAPDVVTVILSFENRPKEKYSFRARVAYHNILYSDLNCSVWEIDQHISIDNFKKDKDLKINLRSNFNFSSINRKIEIHKSLDNSFKVRQGTKPYGKKENKEVGLLSKIQVDESWEKAINGRNISRYFIEFENDFVHRTDDIHSILPIEIINDEKIYFQRMRKISLFPRIVSCYDNNQFHGLYTCSVITKKKESKLELKYLLCLLNSRLINLWYKYFDTDIEIKLASVKQIPVPEISYDKQRVFIESANFLIDKKKELNDILQKFKHTINRKFSLEELSNKLQDWYLLTYKEFIAELGKKKVKLSLSDEAEWEVYFLQEQKKAMELKTKIEVTDKEIDQMVYKLYNLTEEEIAIVEGSAT